MTTIKVRVTREYEVNSTGWAAEYDLGRETTHEDIETYLGERGPADADFADFHESEGTVVQTRRTVLVGPGLRLIDVPSGAVEYATTRLGIALRESPERRDPNLLLLQILSDIGLRLDEQLTC